MLAKYICPEISISPDNQNPLNLNNSKKIFQVTRGIVNIFIFASDPDNSALCSRFPVVTLREGDLFCGFNNPALSCFAIGTIDAAVDVFSAESVCRLWRQKEYSSVISDLFLHWFAIVTEILRSKNRVGREISGQLDEITVESAQWQLAVKENRVLCCNNLCWLSADKSIIAYPFVSDEKMPDNFFYPVSQGLRANVLKDGNITVFSAEGFESDASLQSAVFAFMTVVFDEINQCRIDSGHQEHQKMLLTEEYAQKKYEATLRTSGAIISSGKKHRHDNGAEQDAACNEIAAAVIGTCRRSHIRIKLLPGKVYEDTVNTVFEICRDNNIRVREVVLQHGWWQEDNGMLLAFHNSPEDDTVKPVVLESRHGNSYVMFLPGGDRGIPVTQEIAEKIAPTGYMFYRPLPDEPVSIKAIGKFALAGVAPDLIRCGILGLLGAAVGMLIPEITRIFTDTIIPEAAVNRMFQLAMLVVISAISAGLFEFVKGLALTRFETKSDWTLQAAVMDRVMKMPVGFFKDYTSGDLTERTLAISYIRMILSGTVLSSLMSFLFSLVYFVQLFSYNVSLAFKAFLFCLIPALVAGIVNIKKYEKDKCSAELQGKMAGTLMQFIQGSAKIITTSSEKRSFVEWAKDFNRKKEAEFKSGKILKFQTVFMSVFPVLITLIFYSLYMSAAKKGTGTLSTGSFLAFMAAFSAFQGAFISMISALSSSIMVVPLYKRAKPILDTLPEILESKPSVVKLNGSIEVNHVNFRYTPDAPLVLKDVSLKVEPGEFVALVGGSGSGKSTLLRLLLGFEKPESGTLYFDNQDIETIDISSVRRRMGVVLQNGSLMQGSIYKNIAGSTALTLDEAWEAARMAGLDDDINQMPMGMHTEIPMGGSCLSGGQRQRLIIARAIAHHPDVLFFDEATSALDNRTQQTVSESLERMNVTRVVIAHRLSTIINADRIYVLQDGEILESGNYQTLMEKKGFFYELASRQNV